MKAFSLCALALVLALAALDGLAAPARAEWAEGYLFDDNDTTVGLRGYDAQPGAVTLTLTLSAPRDRDIVVSLCDARFNGAPAGFGRGWADEQLSLTAGESREEDVLLVSDFPDEAAESVSFRVAAEGLIGAPATLSLADGTVAAQPVSPPLIRDGILLPEGPVSPVRLTDELTAEELSLLDYGQAQIVLRTEDARGVLFTPIVTVPLAVDAGGRAEGVFSGLTLLLDTAPDVPFQTVERSAGCEAGATEISAPMVALTGETIEFAEQALSIVWDGGAARLTGQAVTAYEIGGTCAFAPWDLFDQIYLSHQVFAMAERGRAATLTEADSLNRRTPIDGPLTLRLADVRDLGDIWVYAEYFFTDNTDTVRPARPLTAPATALSP